MMLLNLTELSAEPMHSQISRQLVEKILSGELAGGAILEPARALARKQRVNVRAVEKAYDKLTQDGLIASSDQEIHVRMLTPEKRREIASRRTFGNDHTNDLFEIQEQLVMAGQIQANLLPEGLPDDEYVSVAASSVPSRTVGGDFYDYIPFDEQRFALVIGDACGNGLPAAMLISQIQAMLKSEVNNGNHIGHILENMNNQLVRFTPKDKFVTLVYGVFDRKTSVFEYAIAGHHYPIVLHKNGRNEYLNAGGPALGIFPQYDCQTGAVALVSGDIMCLFTDGVTEAMDVCYEQYSEERLIDLLIDNRHRSPQEVVDIILEDLHSFHSQDSLQDDMTVMILKMKESTKNEI
jgi:sigma-B regulation protein RsbU (phosphoserine phosphatase)